MEYKIANLKFFLPPIILILFVVLGMHVFGCEKQIANFQSYLRSYSRLVITIGAALSILTLGILISGISYTILSIFCKAPYPKWDKKAEEKLKESFGHWPSSEGKKGFSKTAKGEVAEWFLHKELHGIVGNKMQKRWEMTLLNFNICVAIVISMIIVICLISSWKAFSWKSLWILLSYGGGSIMVFAWNFYKSRKSIHDINHILLCEYANKVKHKQKDKE